MQRQLEREAKKLGLALISGEDNYELSARIDIAKEILDDWDEDDFEKNVELTWTQRDGKQILVPNMTDSHLANAIRLLEREGKAPSYWHTEFQNEVERRRKMAPPEILCSQCGEPLWQLKDCFVCESCERTVDGINWDF